MFLLMIQNDIKYYTGQSKHYPTANIFYQGKMVKSKKKVWQDVTYKGHRSDTEHSQVQEHRQAHCSRGR